MSETKIHSSEYDSSDRFSPSAIDKLNARSWYLDSAERQPFVALSVTSVGPSRETGLARFVLAGNMSEKHGSPDQTNAEKASAANMNVNRHVIRMGYNPEQVRIMRPQQDYSEPLKVIDANDRSIIPETGKATWIPEEMNGDFVYTRDPDTVLGVRPADCPIVMTRAETPEGTILSITHFAWKGAKAGYVDQMFDRFDDLGVDLSTARMYISPGVEAHNFSYTNDDPDFFTPADLFVDVAQRDDGKIQGFVDLPGFVRERIKSHGVSDYQIFQDTSDTSLPESGYSSHSRSIKSNGAEQNSRGIFLASLSRVEPES